MLEGGAWSDKFRLSLDYLVDDDVRDDFELFFEFEDDLEPFWLSGWDAALHFLVTEWYNGLLIGSDFARRITLCDSEPLDVRGFISYLCIIP